MMVMDAAVQLSLFDDLARAPGTPSPGRRLPPRAQHASARIGAWVLTGLPYLPDALQPGCQVLTTHGERLTLVAIMPHRIGAHDCWRLVLRSDDVSAPWSIVPGVRDLPDLGLTTLAGRDLLPLCAGFIPTEGDDHGETLCQPRLEPGEAPVAIAVGDCIHRVMPDGTSVPVVVLGRRGPWLLVRLPAGGQDLLHVSQAITSPIGSLDDDDARIMGPDLYRTWRHVVALVGDWFEERAALTRAALEAACRQPASDASAWSERHTHWQHLCWLRAHVGREPTAAERALLVREISLGAEVLVRLEPSAHDPTSLTLTLTQGGRVIATVTCTPQHLLDVGGSDPQAGLVRFAEQVRLDAQRPAAGASQVDAAAEQAQARARPQAVACAQECLATLCGGSLPSAELLARLAHLVDLSNDPLAGQVLSVLRQVQGEMPGTVLEVTPGIWTAVIPMSGGVGAYGAVSSTGFYSHALTGSAPAHLRHLHDLFLQEEKAASRRRSPAVATETATMSERARARIAAVLIDGMALAADATASPGTLFAWMGRVEACLDNFPRPTDPERVLGGLVALVRARLESAVAQVSQDVRLSLFRRPGEWDEACSFFSKPLVLLLVDGTWHATALRSLALDLDEAVALARVRVATDITHDDH